MSNKSFKGKKVEDVHNDYDGFVEKFKPKLTTDDCITPPEVYDCIKKWACDYFELCEDKIVRPFWPGGDYEHFNYPEGCIVLDNPPFSIVSKIQLFYREKGIRYFLFCGALTAFSSARAADSNIIFADTKIVYANGAKVPTAFVHNLGGPKAMSVPDLASKVKYICDMLKKGSEEKLPKYRYPDNIVTSAMFDKYARAGVVYSVGIKDSCFVKALDSQAGCGKRIYGGGLLISQKAAEEKAVAERAYAEKAAEEERITWELSDREREIIESLG